MIQQSLEVLQNRVSKKLDKDGLSWNWKIPWYGKKLSEGMRLWKLQNKEVPEETEIRMVGEKFRLDKLVNSPIDKQPAEAMIL